MPVHLPCLSSAARMQDAPRRPHWVTGKTPWPARRADAAVHTLCIRMQTSYACSHLDCRKVGSCIGAVQGVSAVVAHHALLPAAPCDLYQGMKGPSFIPLQLSEGGHFVRHGGIKGTAERRTSRSPPQRAAPEVPASAPFSALPSAGSSSGCSTGVRLPSETSPCMHVVRLQASSAYGTTVPTQPPLCLARWPHGSCLSQDHHLVFLACSGGNRRAVL